MQPEVQQDLRSNPVVPEIGCKAESLVRLHGVGTAILQLVRLEFVEKANPTTLLIEIHDHAAALSRDQLHGAMQLPAAVASPGMEDVTRQALRVHAHQHALATAHVTEHERHMLVRVDVIPVSDDAELAELRREARLGNAVDQAFRAKAMGDDLRDRDERQIVLLREAIQVGPLRRCAIRVEDLADDTGRLEARKPHEVHCCLGVADALQHAAFPRPQGMHVPGPAQVGRHRVRIRGRTNGSRPIRGADAGRDAETGRRIHRDGERRTHCVRVLPAHQRKVELGDTFRTQREADHALRFHEEVHHRRRDEFRGADEVALILPILVVRDDQELSLTKVGDGLLDAAKRHGIQKEVGREKAAAFTAARRCTYFATTSISVLRRSPA